MMRKFLITSIYCLLQLSVFAQEQDSTKESSLSWAAFPAVGFQPETSFQFGAVAVMTLNNVKASEGVIAKTSSFTPFFIYTLRNQFLTELNADYFWGKGNNLNITPRFYIFPDFYFGLGNDNDPDVSESYTNQYFQVDGQFLKPISPTTYVGLGIDLHNTTLKNFEEGKILEQGNIPGVDGGFLLGFGPSFRNDSRDHVLFPTKGYFINFNSLFNYIGDFSYSSFSLDLRRYFSIKDDTDVLAIQLSSTFTVGDDFAFYKLPQLGGGSRLRGITNASLYRDRNLIFSQVEYRKHLFWLIGGAAYVGVGDVARNLSRFDISEFKYVGGLGVRFRIIPEDKLNIRFDYGLAKGGQSAFYIGIREAF